MILFSTTSIMMLFLWVLFQLCLVCFLYFLQYILIDIDNDYKYVSQVSVPNEAITFNYQNNPFCPFMPEK